MKRLIITLAILISFASSINAELIDNGDGTVTQIRSDGSVLMWLEDFQYAGKTGFDNDGRMNWDRAFYWTESLVFAGYDDWRLPAILPINGSTYDTSLSYDGSTDGGYNITSLNSELAYLYYVELGNLGRYDTSGNSQPGPWFVNSGPFENILYERIWSGNLIDILGTTSAFQFDFSGARQSASNALLSRRVWAVRDVTTVVPEPISSTLFIIGGATLGFRRFRKKFSKQ